MRQVSLGLPVVARAREQSAVEGWIEVLMIATEEAAWPMLEVGGMEVRRAAAVVVGLAPVVWEEPAIRLHNLAAREGGL